MTSHLATRLTGSSDLFQSSGRAPYHSVNFVTCHDGFTLHDVVSYSKKHNLANGENNLDGTDDNFSCNYGVEGETANGAINELRIRQIKNFLATLMLAQGVPMLLGGDEFRRTQGGNNNAYCQDNEISWFNWDRLGEHKEIFRFTKELIILRKKHPALRRAHFFSGQDHDHDGILDISWFTNPGMKPDWEKAGSSLACLISGSKEETGAPQDDNDFYLIFNAAATPLTFSLPRLSSGKSWWRTVDTAQPSPKDICTAGKEIKIGKKYAAQSRSLVVLISRP
jgi:glycogen operon protein